MALSGGEGRSITVQPGAVIVIGRSRTCDLCLPYPDVSRQHARVGGRGGGWYVMDLESTTGTFLNGVRLSPATMIAIARGDLLQIGPSAYRVGLGDNPATMAPTFDDMDRSRERAPRRQVRLASPADRRLRLLTECVGGFAGASDERTLATMALRTVLEESGYARGAVLRRADGGEAVEVLQDLRRDPADQEPFVFSRSLVKQAGEGRVAVLTAERRAPYGESIADLRIHSALCAPILLGAEIEGYLYLDARGHESSVRGEADGFCDAVSKAYAMALANLKRVELERRQLKLQADLEAARLAQQFILPPPAGSHGCIRYAMRMQAGLFVAGDLFDVTPLPGGRVAVALGDVAGHGVSSAMLMAAAQAHLHALIRDNHDPGEALTQLNRYVSARSEPGRFATLWVGIFSPDGTLRFCDAGHGYWAVWSAGQVSPGRNPMGIPIGIEPGATYGSDECRLTPGDRVLLYSDGLIEQRDADGQQVGREPVLAALGKGDPEDDIRAIFQTVCGRVGGASLADDATAAVVHFVPGNEVLQPGGDDSGGSKAR